MSRLSLLSVHAHLKRCLRGGLAHSLFSHSAASCSNAFFRASLSMGLKSSSRMGPWLAVRRRAVSESRLARSSTVSWKCARARYISYRTSMSRALHAHFLHHGLRDRVVARTGARCACLVCGYGLWLGTPLRRDGLHGEGIHGRRGCLSRTVLR